MERLRLDHVDGMRAVAALVVYFNHAYAQTWCAFYDRFPPAPFGFLSYWLAIGHLAVSVFIVISGFCLYLPLIRSQGLLRGGVLSFFKRRARRILPPYYAALALSLLLIATVIGEDSGSLWDVSARVRASDVASHVLLLQNVFGTGRINYAFWSIALEWQIYFLFPVLAALFVRFGPLPAVLAGFALGYPLTLSSIPRLDHANLHYLGLFALGMAAARISYSGSSAALRRFPWAAIAGANLLLATALVLHWGWRTAIAQWPLLDLIVGVGTFALLVAAARAPQGLITRAFSFPPLVSVGRFSYSLYLIHAPLLQVIWLHALKPIGLGDGAIYVALVLGGLPLVLGASYAFFKAFEEPFMRAPGGRVADQRAPVSP
jgi:peptidoglycan/LPS O-acetylase OafA/YrhL